MRLIPLLALLLSIPAIASFGQPIAPQSKTPLQGKSPEDEALRKGLLQLPEGLLRRQPRLSAEQNLLDPLLKAAEEVESSEDERLTNRSLIPHNAFPQAAEARQILELLRANRSPLRELDRLLRTEARLQLPRKRGDTDAEKAAATQISRLAFLKHLRARQLIADGNLEAVNDIVDLVRLSRLLLRADGTMVDFVVAGLVLQSAAIDAQCLIASPSINKATLEKMTRVWPTPSLISEAYESTLREEFHQIFVPALRQAIEDTGRPNEGFLQAFQQQLDELKKHGVDIQPRPLDVVETLRIKSRVIQADMKDARRRWVDRKGDGRKFFGNLERQWQTDAQYATRIAEAIPIRVAKPTAKETKGLETAWYNLMGRSLLATLDHDHNVSFSYGLQAECEATRLLVAIRMHYLDKNGLPKSLAALKKEGYLKDVPMDPFARESFQYEMQSGYLWSVGADGRNSPRSAGKQGQRRPIWRVGFAVRRRRDDL